MKNSKTKINKNNKNSKEINNSEIKIDNHTKVIENKKKFFRDNFLFNLTFVVITTFLVELIFRAISKFNIFDYATLRIFISCFIMGLIITFLSHLMKRKWLKNTIIIIYLLIYTVYSFLQLGFLNYLGVYISFNTSSQLGAVTDYIYEYLKSFDLIFICVLLPFFFSIAWLILNKRKRYEKISITKKTFLVIPILIISIFTYYLTLKLDFMQNKLQLKSNQILFVNPDVPTIAVNQFGTTMFGILDLKSFLFPVSATENNVYNSQSSGELVTTKPSREVPKYLDDLAVMDEKNKKYQMLNNYFANQLVTDYNDYTGLFEGKNVVIILMESVNNAIINEEYFPNFYNLYSNGWNFLNTYSPRNSCATGNNEFSTLTSLYSIYNTCTANVYKKNTYFNSIFNLFNEHGYNTTSMHNFTEWYYYRSTIHKNMGSQKFYGANDLKIKTSVYGEWPSDVEFFEKAFDILLNNESDKPFMTFLTTVTSHQPYSTASTLGDLHKDYFKSLGYSTASARYLSKLKVLDDAIGVMIQKLTENQKLDDTVIVMLADHYPYGLNKSSLKEVIDHDITEYEAERTPFVIYNSSMTSETFTQYNSYINVLPTIANLFNLDYDPRLYMGDDLFSDTYESRVVFADGSWKNELAFYDASTSKIKYYTDFQYTIEEIQRINLEIDAKISMSSMAIKNNYFKYLENKYKEFESADNSTSDVDININETNIDN